MILPTQQQFCPDRTELTPARSGHRSLFVWMQSGWIVGVLFAIVVVTSFAGLCLAEEGPERLPSNERAGLRLPARPAGSDSHVSSSRSKSSSSTSGLWTTMLSLGAIVGCLLLIGQGLRPYLGATRGLPVDVLELLGRRVIDQKVAIHLVRCGRRILVLSVSAEGARTLSEITDPDEVQRLMDACSGPPEGRLSAIHQFSSVIRGTSKPVSKFPSEGLKRA